MSEEDRPKQIRERGKNFVSTSNYIRPDQYKALKKISVEEGPAVSFIIRKAIDEYLEKRGLLSHS